MIVDDAVVLQSLLGKSAGCYENWGRKTGYCAI